MSDGTRIFISYRREDSAGHAGRVSDQLQSRFGEAQVFLDVISIPGATDFTQVIQSALSASNVLIVVIGPMWLNSSSQSGKRRLNDPNDLVRAEIRIALQRKVTIIPVLVAGARMPRRDELPQDISDLAGINAVQISDERFRHDMDRLEETIRRDEKSEARMTPKTEIYPGVWEICMCESGINTAIFRFELNRNETLSGKIKLGGNPPTDGYSLLLKLGVYLGQFEYGAEIQKAKEHFIFRIEQAILTGRWGYNNQTKMLYLQIQAQAFGLAFSPSSIELQITGQDRGVYNVVNAQFYEFILKRIG